MLSSFQLELHATSVSQIAFFKNDLVWPQLAPVDDGFRCQRKLRICNFDREGVHPCTPPTPPSPTSSFAGMVTSWKRGVRLRLSHRKASHWLSHSARPELLSRGLFVSVPRIIGVIPEGLLRPKQTPKIQRIWQFFPYGVTGPSKSVGCLWFTHDLSGAWQGRNGSRLREEMLGAWPFRL
jgi:hypothetical protein